MAYSFELTSNAINEINNTLEYICINLKNKNTAINIICASLVKYARRNVMKPFLLFF